jgi:hypothetical protein
MVSRYYLVVHAIKLKINSNHATEIKKKYQHQKENPLYLRFGQQGSGRKDVSLGRRVAFCRSLPEPKIQKNKVLNKA